MRKIKNKETKKIFFRTVCITLVLLICPIMVFMGSAKAYEAIRENGFAEKTSAFQIAMDEKHITVKFFDEEYQMNTLQNSDFIEKTTSKILYVTTDVLRLFAKALESGFSKPVE